MTGNWHRVEQYRYPVKGRYWELPQGVWEQSPNTDLLEVARGELQEETGLIAAQMVRVGHLFEAYSSSNQGYYIFVATKLRPAEHAAAQEEQDLITMRFALAQVERMICDGEIKDATTVAAPGPLRLKGLL
jgi:ADP-ribose pyrophosphatase